MSSLAQQSVCFSYESLLRSNRRDSCVPTKADPITTLYHFLPHGRYRTPKWLRVKRKTSFPAKICLRISDYER